MSTNVAAFLVAWSIPALAALLIVAELRQLGPDRRRRALDAARAATGRAGCAIGLHRIDVRQGLEPWRGRRSYVTYNRCTRAGCHREAWQEVDALEPRIPSHPPIGG